MRRGLLFVIAILLVAFLFAFAEGQTVAEKWTGPSRPITMLVQWSAGGSTDITARIICKNAEEYVGQSINVVNQSSGGGVVAHSQLVNAQPDGYTLLLANPPNMLIDHFLKEGVDYTIEDFKPIIMFAADPILLITRSGSVLDRPLTEFVDYVKAQPDQIKIGNPGQWGINDFGRISIEYACGIKFKRIVYGGGADAVVALLGKEVDLITTFYGDARQHIESGEFKVLGVADNERLSFLPDVPTFKEMGFDAETTSWRCVVGPKGISQDMVDFYHNAFKSSMDMKATKDLLEKAGINIKYMGPSEAARFLEQEKKNYEAVVDRENLIEKVK